MANASLRSGQKSPLEQAGDLLGGAINAAKKGANAAAKKVQEVTTDVDTDALFEY